MLHFSDFFHISEASVLNLAKNKSFFEFKYLQSVHGISLVFPNLKLKDGVVKMLSSAMKICYKCQAVVLFLILGFIVVKADEMKAEDVIAKHLDSIGSKEKRETIKNRLATGTSEFESKLPARKTTGKGAIVSELNDLMFLSSFRSNEYPYEKIGFFKGSINIPLALQNSRSPLGVFIADHSVLLTEGLFTGSISSTWNLSNSQIKRGKIEFAGIKKIEGHKVYALAYYPRTSSNEFTVKMYFDIETFQHVRTEYRDAISGKQAAFGQLGNQSGVIIALTEDFGDFKTVDGLTFPYSYKIKYMTDSNSGTYEWNWGFKIEQYRFNEKLKENFFSF